MRDAHALVQRGIDSLRSGAVDAAIGTCREALQKHPELPRTHFLAGLIAIEVGELHQAASAFETTVLLNESFSIAWVHLARTYAMLGEFIKAEGCLTNAAITNLQRPAMFEMVGTTMRLLGRLRDAQTWFRRAVEAEPQNPSFLVSLANSHLYLGELVDARGFLEKALDIAPADSYLHWLYSRVGKVSSDDHLRVMRQLAEGASEPRDVAWLNYAMGKELEDLERWEEAFAAFERGAGARRATVEYNEAALLDVFRAASESFTSDWLEKNVDGVADAGPIFIVGQPRTGTTLLERMLGSHPKVVSAGELRHFGVAIRKATGINEKRTFSADLMRAAADASVELIGETYRISTEYLRREVPHFVNKLPTNYLYLPLIAAALPRARIIHVRRDPMDSCFAMYKQLFADAYIYTYDQEEVARIYVAYSRLMDTWRERFGDRFIEVTYEDLVTDTESTLRGVMQYVGLSWHEDCLNFTDDAQPVTTASAAQVREGAHTRSVGRWKRYEEQLEPMRRVLAAAGLA